MTAIITRTASARDLRLALALCFVAIASSSCSKEEPTKDQYLSRANDYFAAEQYDKAETEYRNVLRLAPTDPVALRQLGIIYYDQGQLTQAFPLLRKSAELQPQNLDMQLRLGLTYLSARAYKEARDAALLVLNQQPGHEDALLLLADTVVAPKDLEETHKLIEGLREQDKDRTGYHLALGALAMRQQDQALAENEFKAALDLDPQSSTVHLALGNLYWSRKNLDEANQAFKAAADLAPLRSPRRLRYVEFKLLTGAVAEAKNVLEEFTRKVPDYLPPRVYLMKLVCAEKGSEECAALVQNILEQDPLNYDALFQIGSISLAKRDSAKATGQFEQLSKIYPQSPQVRYQLALAYLLNARDASVGDKALASLNVAIGLDPHFDQATLLLAELKISKGEPTAAIESLTQLIQVRPQIADAHFLLARAYLAQQNPEEALTIYRQMTELFPLDPQPPLFIGMILSDKGQHPDARKAFEKSLEISPDYLPALEKLVDLDIAEGQYATSIDRVQKQIDKNSKLAQPLAVRAKIYFAQRDFVHAEADLLKAIDLDPNLQPAYVLLAGLYVASNRQDQAIEKLTAFVEKNKEVRALMQLAIIHEQLKHFDAARDAYEKLLTVDPRFFPALNNLAVLYSEHLARLDTAYDLATRARRLVPEEPHTADTLGWILFKKGQYGNALRFLQESAAKLPDGPEIQFHLGMAHYMLGEEGPARVELQKAATASQVFPGKDEAQQRLAILAIDIQTANTTFRTELENHLRERLNDPAALVRLAELQERDGAVDRALKIYEKIVDEYPDFAPATRHLAILYGRRSVDDQKAYEVAMKAGQAYPEDPELAKTLGILRYRRGYYPQCVELLQKAAAKRKDDPELLYYLGMTYYQLKQWNEAKETLERVLTLNLTTKFADDARRALADCCQSSK